MKFQAPSSKFQNSETRVSGFAGFGNVGFGAYVEFRTWNLELHTL